MEWRKDSSQWGSNARRRARPQAAQPRASSAATAATTIAAVDSLPEDFDRARARVRAGAVDVDLRMVIGWGAVVVAAECARAEAGTEKAGVESAWGGGFVAAVAGVVVPSAAVITTAIRSISKRRSRRRGIA